MMRRIPLVLLALALLPALALAQLPPQKALESLVVAEGLQVELFAAEPMLINPTSIDVDHLGRVWVCEAVNYRRLPPYNRPILREAGDRIVILTDKDGDGKADDSTVFYQGKEIYGPLGIAIAPIANAPDSPGACKVFVCQSPDILLFEDLNGDGKADGPPKKFMSGFGGFDHDHGVHGINIGPDGKLYFTVGDSGVNGIQSTDGKGRKWFTNDTDCQKGTVWRCDMDGKNLELIAHNFRNNYECCVNSFGEIWLSDNDDDGNQQTRICYVMPGGNYGYGPRGPGQSHWHEEQPGIVHKVLRTGFGSPTGICFYEGTLLPKKYHGQLLHTDAGPREFRCFHLKPKGAGYEAEKEVLVTSTDNWFRLSDVCVAPDGSVFLADWYDPGVGGHGMGDWTRGRIYRVTPKGHQGYKVPKVELTTKEQILESLGSPNLAVRSVAIRAMANWPAIKSQVTDWEEAIGVHHPDRRSEDYYRHLIRMAQATGSYEDPKRWLGRFELMLNSEKSWPLMLAFRLVAIKANHSESLMEWLTALPSDLIQKLDAAALREYLLLVRTFDAKAISPSILKVAARYDGQDHFYRAALNIACGTDPKRRDAILADFEKHFPEWNDKVADLVWELRPKSMLPKLQTLLSDAKLTPEQRGRIVDILAVYDGVDGGKAMLNVLKANAPEAVKNRAIDNLKKFLPTKWNAIARTPEFRDSVLAGLKNKDTRASSMQLIVAARIEAAIDGLAQFAQDKSLDLAERRQAVRTLGELRSDKAIDALAKLTADSDLRIAAIQALGLIRSPRSITPLKIIVLDAKQPLEVRSEAVAALAASFDGTRWLIEEKKNNVLPAELHADAGRMVRNSPFQGLRNQALLVFPPPGKLDPKKLPTIAIMAKRTGDAARGKQVLAASLKNEAQCLKCHTIHGTGGQIGPDLSMIGKKASRENLIESILLPSKAIADQFLMYQLETKTGQQLSGLLIQQGPAGVTLRDANGKDHNIAKDDIESLTKSTKSIMPEDIIAALTEDELTDVVEYLLTLKTPSLTPTWQLVGPFPAESMLHGLDKAIDVEKFPYDPTDTFMDSGQRKSSTAGVLGRLMWEPVRPDASGYIDLAALHGPAANNSVSYATCTVESPAEQEATFILGSDDGAKLWVNGKEVFKTTATRAAAPDQDRVKVKLKKGTNAILLKVANGNGPHGFYLSILSEQELKMK